MANSSVLQVWNLNLPPDWITIMKINAKGACSGRQSKNGSSNTSTPDNSETTRIGHLRLARRVIHMDPVRLCVYSAGELCVDWKNGTVRPDTFDGVHFQLRPDTPACTA